MITFKEKDYVKNRKPDTMKRILFLLIFICICTKLFSEDKLYLNYPGERPSKQTVTTFGKELISLINNSKNSIYLAIYGLRDQKMILNALINAKKRGVEIKVVVDSDSKNENYYTHTNLLYKYFETKSDKKSHIMHNKFFIFDKKTVWTGSSNISNTGTGGYNTNNVVVIENKVIADAYYKEFYQMFYKGKFSKKKKKNYLENIKTDNSEISIYFSPKSNTYNKAIKKLLYTAKEYIYVPMFYLTHKQFAYDLRQAKKKGVDIRIILDASAAGNKYSVHKLLRDYNIPVKVENFGGKMHNKSIIIDDKYIVSGSMNLTKAGNKKNDENTLIIKNEKLAKKYKFYFQNLWNVIPNKFLYRNVNPESLESRNSCFDNIDNDFDKNIDIADSFCLEKSRN